MNCMKFLFSFSLLIVMMMIIFALTIIPASADPQPVHLTGRTTFVGHFAQSGFVFSPDWYNYCNAEAVLTQVEKKSYILEVNEWDCGRVCTWDLKITNNGVVIGDNHGSCCVDGDCVAEVKLHTGCPADHGIYPIYRGKWDGANFNISSHFHGRCDGGTYWGDAAFWDGWGDLPPVDDPEGILDDGVTWDDGPAHVTFGIELTTGQD